MTESPPPEDPRDALIREQAARIAAQDEEIAAQGERVSGLEGLVRELQGQLEQALRAASRNSGNSSMAPSGDDQPGRKPPRKERRAAERAEKKRRQGEAARVAGRGDALAQGRRDPRSLPAGPVRVRR